MKKIFSLLIGLLCTFAIFAQAPNNLSYQATVRKSDGSLLTLAKVNFKFSILQTSSSGPIVYEETQSATSNKDGLVTLKIGAGNPTTGNFSTIDWSTGLYFVRTRIDITGGTNFILFSVGQLSSVPYAFFANEAGSIDYAKVKNAPNLDSLQDKLDSLLTRIKLLEQQKGASGLSVTDIDGNIYPLTVFGSQVWMAENLRVSRFNDGTPLIEVKDISWNSRTTPIYCWPQNDSLTYASLHAGMIYNGFTATASKNICPTGFRVPTVADYDLLIGNIVATINTGTLSEKKQEAERRLLADNPALVWIYGPSGASSTKLNFNLLPVPGRSDDLGVVTFPIQNKATLLTQTVFITDVALKFYGISPNTDPSGTSLFTKFGGSIRCIKQ